MLRLAAPIALLAGLAQCGPPSAPQSPGGGPTGRALQPLAGRDGMAGEISDWLAENLADAGIPGGAAAVVSYGEPTVVGSAGVRKAGTEVAFGPGDLVHLGSCSKAIQAALIARLVEADVLSFETTIAEGLPDLAARLHPDFRGVTIRQLLHHTGGTPPSLDGWRSRQGSSLPERRRLHVLEVLQKAPAHPPGSRHAYSNFGYMVTCAIAEARTRTPWEELVRAQVFEPLGMTSAGFGPPGELEGLAQPWGHVPAKRGATGGKWKPVQLDNDPTMAGAGVLHMTLEDWGRFVLALSDPEVDSAVDPEVDPEVDSAEDPAPFLRRTTRDELLKVGLNDYACGWMVVERGWSRGPVLTHNGSNTTWFSLVWAAPREGRAFLVAFNAAPDSVGMLADQAIGHLMGLDDARRRAR